MTKMKYSSRKFVDLIREQSSKYANWDPPKPVEVGEFGTIDKDTGEFEREGNIYTDAEVLRCFPELQNHPPVSAEPEERWVIASERVTHSDIAAGPEVSVGGLAEATIQGRWQFASGRRGALLVMLRPQITHIPREVVLKRLAELPSLYGMKLVTEVVSCPAYALYLSEKGADSISLALIGTVPVPGTPLGAGAGVEASWWTEKNASSCRYACNPTGTNSYRPLFTLKNIRGKRRLLMRDSPVPEPEGDDLWVDAIPPWLPLDEDGEEEEEAEDTVFD